MSLAADSPVHSSSTSSDDFAAYLEAELEAASVVAPISEVKEKVSEHEDVSANYDDYDSDTKRNKRRKVEMLKTSSEQLIKSSDVYEPEAATLGKDVCRHPGRIRGFCIRCGQYLGDEESGVSLSYMHKNLRLTNDEIARVRDNDLKNLVKHKKLYLVLDLDHTLLNSTRLKEIREEEKYLNVPKDDLPDSLKNSLYRLDHMKMMTKLRPSVHSFLREVSKLFEMYIYTMGRRAYALEMAKLLDPQDIYFQTRVIAQENSSREDQKALDIIPGQESAVLILDDTEEVWVERNKENVIEIGRYIFFGSSCHHLHLRCKSLSELRKDESETDGALASILRVLQQIHSSFFDPEHGESLVNRDVRQLLRSARKEVLKDCKIIFSHDSFSNSRSEKTMHRLWKLAEQLGATCCKEHDSAVTHVVSVNAGTRESCWAVQNKQFSVHPKWIEAAKYWWRRMPEANYPVLVREKDVCWEYAEKLEGNRVRCKFCHRVLNGGISRLKHHLSRIPSKGVNPCSKVRDDVADRVRSILAFKEEGKESPMSKKQNLTEIESSLSICAGKDLISANVPPATRKFFPPITQLETSPTSDEDNAERSIALFFFENKLDFSIARSSSYHQMIEAIGKCGSGFMGPSTESLKTAWLENIKSEVISQSKVTEKEWTMTGCTVIAETWTDNRSRAVINFLVSSPSRISFHKSVDVSSFYKNIKCLSDLFDSVIQEFGPENIVQIIIDGTLNCNGVVNHILQSYATIFVSPCAFQCLDSILEEFSKVDWVSRCILQAQTISKLVYNSSSALDLMKTFTGGQDILKSGVTRSVSNFLSLQCMLKQRSKLKHFLNSPEFSADAAHANKPQSLSCIAIVDDAEFWRLVEECVAVSEPFLQVMREVSGGKPGVGFIYELMTRAKESIRTYYIMDEIKCRTFLDIVDKKWQNNLHSPLHSAAAFLNPSIQYNPETKFLASIKEDFFRVLEKLLHTPELRRDITNQILLFTRASGIFGCNLAKEAIDTVPPGIWWEQYGDASPMLQRVAIRILSQVCSTFTCERNWSAFQQIHSEKRNKIDKETLSDIVYISYNVKLERLLSSKCSEADPLQLDDIDMTSEWMEETENTSPVQWLDRFGSALDGNDLNTRQFSTTIFGPNDHIFGL